MCVSFYAFAIDGLTRKLWSGSCGAVHFEGHFFSIASASTSHSEHGWQKPLLREGTNMQNPESEHAPLLSQGIDFSAMSHFGGHFPSLAS